MGNYIHYHKDDHVAPIGRAFQGPRGIVSGHPHWNPRAKEWEIPVRWESGITSYERPGRLTKLRG
jgi:hypothetical protein